MNFKIEQMDRATIFRPNEKRLDSLIAPDLKAEFLILAQPDVQTLVVDLSAVEYIDSAGLSALLLAQRQQVHHRGDMRLVGASNEVKSLLALTALDRIFPMYESVEEALSAPQLSLITVPPGDVTLTTEALKSGIKYATAAAGAVAIADLIMTEDDGFTMVGVDDDLDDDDFEDDDFEDDEELIDEEEGIEADDESDEAASDDDLDDSIDDDDIEEIEEDDMLEADDFDDIDEDEEDEDDLY